MNFVEGPGLHDKFNMTLTVTAVRAVHHFVEKSESDNFGDFIQKFPRLKYSFKELIGCHYSIDILNSKKAKIEYIEPDLLPFE